MQASLNNPKNIDKQGNFGFDLFPNDVHTVSSLIKVPFCICDLTLLSLM
jgi:hypothetical protein